MHPGNTVKVGSGLPQTLKSLTQVQKVPKIQGTKGTKGTKEVKKILDVILNPSKNVQTVQDISPPKVAKTEEILSTDEESDSGTKDSDSVNIKMPKGKKDQDSKLIDSFQKLYSHFDEDDVELCNDILNLLEELKTRGCITEPEYTHIKSILARQIHLNMQETINSTVENMTRDDKNEILGLLRSMKKDEGAEKLLALVKDYFEEEMDLESVLLLIPRLKDKLNALKVKIILEQIEKTRNRVNKIFTQITNGSDKIDILKALRASDLITDEQYEKLTIGPHTLPSISRIIQGKGLYLSRK